MQHVQFLGTALSEGIFAPWLARWRLTVDGEAIATHSSRLLPVRQAGGAPAMLKIAFEAEEKLGYVLMEYWDGDGAARVLAHEADALLLEKAEGRGSLEKMIPSVEDDEATRIICRVAERLHAPRPRRLPDLLPLTQWFEALEPAAAKYGGVLVPAAALARELLGAPADVVVLHGDLHHGNVLDFGERGWLAIDPKRLIGERAFDFANVVRNPEFDIRIATRPGRVARQVAVISEAADIDPVRLLKWIAAFCGLSAAWILDDGDAPELDLAVARIALAELGMS